MVKPWWFRGARLGVSSVMGPIESGGYGHATRGVASRRIASTGNGTALMPTGSAYTGDSVIRVGIMLAQDRALLANAIGVVLNLEPQFEVVAVESHAISDPNQMLSSGADVVLTDDTSLVGRFRERNDDLRVIVIAPTSDPEITLESIRAGASACVRETASPAALANVVRRVHAGEVVFQQDVLLELVQTRTTALPSRPRRTAMLSERELDVLRAMATGARSAEVAEMLAISLNTVRTHLKNILVKLDARSKLEAVIIAIREGRIELPPDLP